MTILGVDEIIFLEEFKHSMVAYLVTMRFII